MGERGESANGSVGRDGACVLCDLRRDVALVEAVGGRQDVGRVVLAEEEVGDIEEAVDVTQTHRNKDGRNASGDADSVLYIEIGLDAGLAGVTLPPVSSVLVLHAPCSMLRASRPLTGCGRSVLCLLSFCPSSLDEVRTEARAHLDCNDNVRCPM